MDVVTCRVEVVRVLDEKDVHYDARYWVERDVLVTPYSGKAGGKPESDDPPLSGIIMYG